MRTAPVNQLAGPSLDGCEPLRLISILQLFGRPMTASTSDSFPQRLQRIIHSCELVKFVSPQKLNFLEHSKRFSVQPFVNGTKRTVIVRLGLVFRLGAMLWAGQASAGLPVNPPVITSLAVAGGNLEFTADFPPGVEQAVLEMRPVLADSWQQASMLSVPADGGTIEFTIPKPAFDSAFFRLNAVVRATTNAQLSAELQYVTVPPLGLVSTNGAASAEAVFHFKGMIDGSDRIVITHAGAFWKHVHWDWPAGAVMANDVQWIPSEKNFLTTTGAVAFLPEVYSLGAASLEVIEGRDVIALERTNGALLVYLDDTPAGAAPYEFKIHFHPAVATIAKARPSPAANLKISALIDGSDVLKITAQAATWMHRAWSDPEAVRLNDIPWDLRQTNVLLNTGTHVFLPAGVDFSTARIIHRQGRDMATVWSDDDAAWITFADNPNGADAYELEISFGQ
jgi:hypothetical protein